jgi:hypothetical protein
MNGEQTITGTTEHNANTATAPVDLVDAAHHSNAARCMPSPVTEIA